MTECLFWNAFLNWRRRRDFIEEHGILPVRHIFLAHVFQTLPYKTIIHILRDLAPIIDGFHSLVHQGGSALRRPGPDFHVPHPSNRELQKFAYDREGVWRRGLKWRGNGRGDMKLRSH